MNTIQGNGGTTTIHAKAKVEHSQGWAKDDNE